MKVSDKLSGAHPRHHLKQPNFSFSLNMFFSPSLLLKFFSAEDLKVQSCLIWGIGNLKVSRLTWIAALSPCEGCVYPFPGYNSAALLCMEQGLTPSTAASQNPQESTPRES